MRECDTRLSVQPNAPRVWAAVAQPVCHSLREREKLRASNSPHRIKDTRYPAHLWLHRRLAAQQPRPPLTNGAD